MNFGERLNAKKNLKVIEFANEFLLEIKPKLIRSAEEGYSAYRYQINTEIQSEKDKLQMYSDTLFVKELNENLDGVKVVYKKEFVENILFRGYGHTNHYLVFSW